MQIPDIGGSVVLAAVPDNQASPAGHVLQLARGFVMGAADIVPGVSGGTVALVLGIYERLIGNIRIGARGLRQLLTGDLQDLKRTLREIEWIWLFTLLAGILSAVAALSSMLETLLNDEPVVMAGLFFGLVTGTIWIAWNLLDRLDGIAAAIITGIAVVLFVLLGLREDTEVAEGTEEIVTQSFWIFALVGAVAICAMILPGISGSFILVMLGMYTEVLGAVNDRDFVSLGAFVVGCVAGLALFSTLLNWLLENYRNWVIAAMIGLMLGSMRVLWPWPKGTFTTKIEAPSDPVVLPIVLALIGAAVVVTVERVSTRVGEADASFPT
ncbi:MAG: putative membrane protein [Candidatus Aldehydirespiratoraceae bacterium]|jgi:putative membrane protein